MRERRERALIRLMLLLRLRLLLRLLCQITMEHPLKLIEVVRTACKPCELIRRYSTSNQRLNHIARRFARTGDGHALLALDNRRNALGRQLARVTGCATTKGAATIGLVCEVQWHDLPLKRRHMRLRGDGRVNHEIKRTPFLGRRLRRMLLRGCCCCCCWRLWAHDGERRRAGACVVSDGRDARAKAKVMPEACACAKRRM